jgi:hypothetical protein
MSIKPVGEYVILKAALRERNALAEPLKKPPSFFDL